MNKDQWLGNLKIAAGRIHEGMARLSGDRTYRKYAQTLQKAGNMQRTVGNARQVIKRLIKQQMPM